MHYCLIRQGMSSAGESNLSNMAIAFVNSTGGVVGANDYAVYVNNHVPGPDSPNASVQVNAGRAYIPNATRTMMYASYLDTATSGSSNVTIATNTSGHARQDYIVLYVNLAASPDAQADNVMGLADAQGPADGTNVPPTNAQILGGTAGTTWAGIGASNPYIILGQVNVPNNFTTISSGITDMRSFAELITNQSVTNSYGINRQAIINGNFDVWQRNTTFTNPTAYTADRWLTSYDETGGTITVSQQDFTIGQTLVPNNPTYYYQFYQTVAGSGGTYKVVGQRIENVSTFSGETITVTYWMKADTTRVVNTTLTQDFGSGGSTAIVVASGSTHNVTTSWQQFTDILSVPSITGKTVGTSSYLELDFNLPINSVMTMNIAQVQVCAGNIALPFQPKSYNDELLACFRYTVDVTSQSTALNMALCPMVGIDSTHAQGLLQLPTNMRISPSLESFTASNFSLGYPGSIALTNLGLTITPTTNKILIQATVASGLTTSYGYHLYRPGNSQNLILSAEL